MAAELTRHQTTLLTATIESLGGEEFGARLLSLLRDVVDFDSAVIMAYPEDARLSVLCDELSARDRALFDGPYRNGLYLLSPLYTQAHAGTRGYFHISEIAPEGFTDSEFYQLYYSTNGAIDQVAFLCESSTGTPVVVSIERTEGLPAFDEPEKAELAARKPNFQV